MRKESIISLLLVLGILLAGCAKIIPARSTLPPEQSVPNTPTVKETIAEPQPQPAEVPQEPPIDRRKMLEAYQFILQQFSFEHIWPDGTDIGFEPDFGYIEENSFFIGDVNEDGTDELVILYSTAPMAGMQARVYGFDGEQAVEELCAFPALEFYSHGLLKVFASHNHSMHMDFWPFTLLQYNPDSHTYELVASVSGWQKEYFSEDYEGNPFPDDIANGENAVYMIIRDGKTETVSSEQYQDWEKNAFADSTPLDFESLSVSEENIKAVTQ